MKCKIILLFCVIFSLNTYSQAWLDVGAKGLFNSTWLFNGNVSSKNFSTYDFSFGNAFGGRLGLNFNEKHALGAEILFSQASSKVTSGGITNGSWSKKTTLNYIDIPLLYRKTGEGSYFEIGPQFSLFQKSVESFENNLTYSGQAIAPYNIGSNDHFNNHVAALVGFGSNLFSLGENLYISLGLRFTYSFADELSDAGGKGKDVAIYKSDKIDFSPYQASHLFTAGFHLEINYDLGYLVSARCGRKEFLFF